MGERSRPSESSATQQAFLRLESLFDFSREPFAELDSPNTQRRRAFLKDHSIIECWKYRRGTVDLPNTVVLFVNVQPNGGSPVTSFSIGERGLGVIKVDFLDVVAGNRKANAVTANLILKPAEDEREKDLRRFRNLAISLVGWIERSMKHERLAPNPLSFSPNNQLVS